jgi:hypothetical protein
MAPEVQEQKYSFAADWWSLGCIGYDLVYGQPYMGGGAFGHTRRRSMFESAFQAFSVAGDSLQHGLTWAAGDSESWDPLYARIRAKLTENRRSFDFGGSKIMTVVEDIDQRYACYSPENAAPRAQQSPVSIADRRKQHGNEFARREGCMDCLLAALLQKDKQKRIEAVEDDLPWLFTKVLQGFGEGHGWTQGDARGFCRKAEGAKDAGRREDDATVRAAALHRAEGGEAAAVRAGGNFLLEFFAVDQMWALSRCKRFKPLCTWLW